MILSWEFDQAADCWRTEVGQYKAWYGSASIFHGALPHFRYMVSKKHPDSVEVIAYDTIDSADIAMSTIEELLQKLVEQGPKA